MKNLFAENNQNKYWRFEFVYSHGAKIFDIELNESP